MADSTLTTIRIKVRRLTRSPSQALITDAQIDDYINTFVLFDFPESLRLSALRTTLTFYTQPNIDTYETEPTDTADPLYDFKNRYITIHQPVFVAGYPVKLSQDRSEFYGLYPLTNSIQATGLTGDGLTTGFSGTLSTIPVLPNKVLFTSKTSANAGLELHDDGSGVLSGDGTGTINYTTGVFSLSFSSAPASAEPINSQVVAYQASRPNVVLYFDNKFIMRPVPDQVYSVSLEAYIRPSELLLTNQSPDLDQWSQYIAYGASIKVFQDRMDNESIAAISPEFKRQELMVNRRTIVQQTEQRVSTIYSNQLDSHYGTGWNNNF